MRDVFRSIGYAGIGLEGIPFDSKRATIANEGGRVVDPANGEQVPGLYAVGWIKRGPSGVIGTNKKDAQETVDNIFADVEAGRIPDKESAPVDSWRSSMSATRGTSRGRAGASSTRQARGEPSPRRVKFARVEEMRETVHGPGIER